MNVSGFIFMFSPLLSLFKTTYFLTFLFSYMKVCILFFFFPFFLFFPFPFTLYIVIFLFTLLNFSITFFLHLCFHDYFFFSLSFKRRQYGAA